MESSAWVLTVVLSTLAALVSMGLTFLLCYWCSRKRHKREETEAMLDGNGHSTVPGVLPRPGSLDVDPAKAHSGGHTMGGMAESIKSSLKFKSPLIKTKSISTQLECEGQNSTENSPNKSKDVGQFWQNRSLSQVDMFIDQNDTSDSVGQIQFSLEYDFKTSTLILKIIQAKELPAMDMGGTSDPYVRVTLLPDKKHRLETKIKRRTLHPRWNETFYFEGFPIQKLQSRVLHLHVFDYDRFSRDDSIGEVFLPLCQVDLSEKPSFWKHLKAPLKNKCGELLISLSYHPTNNELTIVIVKARNLKAKDINGKSDPYVKVWLQQGDKKMEKKKTCIIKSTLNPVYNETFVFNLTWEKLRETSLMIMVMDFDSVGRNELIGQILMSTKGGTTEGKHWNEMISKARQPVLMWHRLKPE